MEINGPMNEIERRILSRGRAYRRFELQFPVRIKFGYADAPFEVEGVSKNVSIGGLLVRSTTSIPQHTPVSFIVSLHGTDAVRPVHVQGEGKVVRVRETAGMYLLAIRCNEPVVHLESFLKE